MSRPVSELHADWLRLVEPEGQFLSLPVLNRAFSSGLDVVPLSIRSLLSEHFPSAQRGATPADDQWDAWLEWLLRDVLAWGSTYRTGDDAAIYSHAVPERNVVLRADGALVDPETDKARALIVRYPHGTLLDRRLTGERWNASPLDRLALLCRAHAVRIGLLTDGERILLAWIPNQGPGGHAIWETGLFTESRERNLLQSFTSLLHASRFFAVREGDQVESLFQESARAESDVTDRLGFQVRQAVELLIAALSRADLESNGALLAGIAPQRVYEAAATVMMRLVFLLFAEERDLLPIDDPFYADSYAASTLREQLDEQAIVEGDEPLERRSAAWFRLLALFRAVYAGLEHDRLRIPPYGGRLFDPDRFPFLEGRAADDGWAEAASKPLPIDDLTVRAILEALQTLPIREGGARERRRLSFQALDVEQIGHVYEGLLDHGAVRVDDVYLGLVGKSGDEAEIPLADLEQKAREGEQPLVSFLHDFTGKSEGAIAQLIKRGRAIALGGDPDARRLINTTCDNDAALASRVSPFFHALRRDLHDLPVVFPPQSLVVKQTSQRRSTGTEYTPRDLAEEMVRYALEPLVYSPGPRDGVEPDQWRLRPSNELLDLKICDPAVGSGAFLVSACRYLADFVVEAWVAEDPARAQSDRDDLTLEARRAVVDRCLYGIDRDSMAVEMAKLSLWLVTMARERPFSFLDHAIRCGDSLLGITSFAQLRYLHIDPESGKRVHASLFDVMRLMQPIVDEAVALREQLKAIPTITIRNAGEKQQLNDEADQLLAIAKIIADGIVATALATAGKSDRQRDTAYFEFGTRVAQALDESNSKVEREEALRQMHLQSDQMLNAGRPADGPQRPTLHWPLAFPEIFEAGGFHAVVSNPPFVRDASLQQTIGRDFRNYLVADIANGKRGRSDLCGYFLLRITVISRSAAIVATNSIAEGDTRDVSLDTLLAKGWQIVRAVRSIPWPGTASVHIAKLWLTKNATRSVHILDGAAVMSISSSLRISAGDTNEPNILRASSGLMFNGSKVNGSGFVLESSEAAAILAAGNHYHSVVKPYMSGDDACTSPELLPSRWIIDFSALSLEQAADEFIICFRIVEERVKPERTRVNIRGEYVLRRPLPQRWWQFGDARRALYEQLSNTPSVIVIPATSKYAVPARVRTGTVFSHSLNVAIDNSHDFQGVLSSRTHYAWMRYRPSTLETRNRYNPSDTLRTFPLPGKAQPLADHTARFDDIRSQVMRENAEGITLTYNRIHNRNIGDASIVKIRRSIEELEYAVLCAYAWDDIDPTYNFYETDQGWQWTISPAVEKLIVGRLLKLNQQRHQEEARNASQVADGKALSRLPQREASGEQLFMVNEGDREVTADV